jgi:hypothetical protein
MMGRYTANRVSSFSRFESKDPSAQLARLNYHSVHKATLEPIGSSSARDEFGGGADDGVPKFLYSVQIVHLKGHRDVVLPTAPSLSADVNPTSFSLLGQAIEICTTIPQWADPDCDKDAKGKKLKILQDIKTVFQNAPFVQGIPDPIVDKFFLFLDANIFRSIPPTPPKYLVGDYEPFIIDVAWSHLSVIYEILNLFFAARPADPRITLQFDRKLLRMFSVPDLNERTQLADFMVKYCAQYPDREKGVWSQMAYILNRYRQRDSDPYTVTPVLQFYASRFKEPKCDHEFRKVIFEGTIIPLISTQHLLSFTAKLKEVVLSMCGRTMAILTQFIKAAILRWPEGCPAKQVEFIVWLNDLTENVSEKEFPHIMKPLFELYARLTVSPFAKVAETSFKIWSNVKILPRIMDNTKVIFSILHPAIIRTMTEHWRPLTQTQALTTLKAMQELDPFMFEQLKMAPQKKKKGAPPPQVDESLGVKSSNWSTIARLAARADRSIVLAQVLTIVTQLFGNPT